MIAVDTSAILAIALDEQDAKRAIAERLELRETPSDFLNVTFNAA